jgi:hypothetical protein
MWKGKAVERGQRDSRSRCPQDPRRSRRGDNLVASSVVLYSLRYTYYGTDAPQK